MSEIIIGIDLGTTNSEVAIVQDGKPRVLSENGDPILPSVVGLADDGRLLVGRAARNQYAIAPERTIKSIKRLMGQDTTISMGEQKFRPQEISAMILKALKSRAEAELGQPVRKAVITVPAFFNNSERQATREAGELAGLEVVRILNEPTAAALTYSPNPTGQERFLVYDLGGGTFDVSILQAEGGVFEVLASHGDTKLGGDDFDQLLLNHLANEFQRLHLIDLREDPKTKARLLRAAEDAKIRLSDHAYTKVEEEFIAEKDGVPLHLSMELDRQDFEALVRPMLDRTLESVQKALDDSKLSAAQIDKVILVGGSTRIPAIANMLEDRLGKPPSREVHPDLCVALGAAMQGAIVAGDTIGAVLVDITPHSLGIKTVTMADSDFGGIDSNYFSRIIHRNTPLPVSRSEVYSTMQDNQSSVDVVIYQGESDDVRQNHRVGEFRIEGLSRVPAGNQITVKLDLSLDGTLTVSAKERATSLQKQITIDNAMARFALTERTASQNRLQNFWGEEHGSPLGSAPLLDPGPGEGQRESVMADALVMKAEHISENVSDEDKTELLKHIATIRSAQADRRWGDLTAACTELTDILFYLEDS